MTEAVLIREICLVASRHGARVFRNNVGSLQDINGRWVRYGVCNPGGADLIGWTVDGRFLAIEVKFGSTATTAPQLRFLEVVRKSGGIGIIARSADDVVRVLKSPATARP